MILKKRNLTRENFTLVELLVVIAIIGILASMLMPALAAAREKGRAASCINTLKNFGLANLMYADDYKALCPVKDPTQNIFYYGVRSGGHGGFKYDLTKGGFLHPYLGNSAKAMVCPSFDVGGNYEEAPQVGGIGYNRLSWSGTVGSADKSISNGLSSLAGISNPAGIVMFGDAGLYASGKVSGTGYLVPNGVGMQDSNGSAHFRHGKMANFVWVDGHVSSERFLAGTELYTGHWGSSDESEAFRYFWPDWSESNPSPSAN